MGFLSRDEEMPRYFFHRKAGIKRETLKDVIVELFELENLVHLCLEDRAIPQFQKALERVNPIIDLKIRSIRKIKQAEFKFSFEVYTQEMADEIRKLEKEVPEGVSLVDYQPVEEKLKENEKLSAYSFQHRYTFRGKGMLKGDFEGVINFYLHCNRSKAKEFILTDDVKLYFNDK